MSVIKYIVCLIVLYSVLTVCAIKCSPVNVESRPSPVEVLAGEPYFILDEDTLMSAEMSSKALQSMMERLIKDQVLIQNTHTWIVNPKFEGSQIKIVIQSRGGYLSLGEQIKETFRVLEFRGLRFHCQVNKAESMAMNLMINICDKISARKSVILMQHRLYLDGGGTSHYTAIEDIRLSNEESNILGVPFYEWHDLARGPKDHVFTLEEIKKYKLVDEWID